MQYTEYPLLPIPSSADTHRTAANAKTRTGGPQCAKMRNLYRVMIIVVLGNVILLALYVSQAPTFTLHPPYAGPALFAPNPSDSFPKPATSQPQNLRAQTAAESQGLNNKDLGTREEVSGVFYHLKYPDDVAPLLPKAGDLNMSADVTPEGRYVTFEPDHGGWNNIRMAFETVAIFALVTRRTLVLPPAQFLYLLNQDASAKKNKLGVSDIFDVEDLRKHLPVITMRDFLVAEKVDTGGTPPEELWGRKLWPVLRRTAQHTFAWEPLNEALWFGDEKSFSSDRARLFKSEKRTMERYVDPNVRIAHFPTNPGQKQRLLTHFYTFLGFQDPSVDRSVKRFARRHLHYKREIFELGAKLEGLLRRKLGGEQYVSYHIRRGDLQYPEVKIPAAKIVANTRDVTIQGSAAYIATDERNKTFFDELVQHHHGKVTFLEDLLQEANVEIGPNYYGMLEQLICSGGKTFVGTHFSTFSGYIARLRGYRGWPSRSNYFGTLSHKYKYQPDKMPRRPHFAYYPREWPTAWERLDVDSESHPRPDLTTDDDQISE